jgi:hypothetical protein
MVPLPSHNLAREDRLGARTAADERPVPATSRIVVRLRFSLPLGSRGRKAAAQNADKSFFVIVLSD